MHSANQILACVAYDVSQSVNNRRRAQVALAGNVNPFEGMTVEAIIGKLEAEINDPNMAPDEREAVRRMISAYRNKAP